ncbi:MAG: PAS domain-containing protein, partial [Acidimicrobiales bacterium]
MTDPEISAELLRALPDAVVVIDEEGRLSWANAATERLFGVAADSLLGTSAFDFVHPDDQELAAVSLASVKGKDVGTPI